ncbi:class II aldolase/adducin family protein [Herbiconiux sp. CPCC 205716]|uniref:Class II aldolase/adducin family protein n=1 Tax=Herbiconiux gentiana TaxID=2970912 RepID=A0ABT2GBW7_9MICO|nr:class II aldolase/adducin family protein [Herbiconiux gentiana]MCS5713616.1 class II aldolase/adducin family protein [Herbiconiux gentiana]
MMDDAVARSELVELSRELGRPDRRWAVLAEGNTSIALGDGRMLVKASGASMAIADPTDFVAVGLPDVLALVDAESTSTDTPTGPAAVDPVEPPARPTADDLAAHGHDGPAVDAPVDPKANAPVDPAANALVGSAADAHAGGAGDDEAVRELFARGSGPGGRRPSVEALLHAVCLALPGVEAVGHTHPVPVNALLCSPRASLLVEGSLFPDQIVVLGTDPLLVPYIDPGLPLARAVRRMLAERLASTGSVPKAVYLANHGMFALGATPAEVLRITEMAVKVAETILGSLPAGGPVFLSPDDVARIDTRPDELLRRAALAAAGAGALPTSPDPATSPSPSATPATPPTPSNGARP